MINVPMKTNILGQLFCEIQVEYTVKNKLVNLRVPFTTGNESIGLMYYLRFKQLRLKRPWDAASTV